MPKQYKIDSVADIKDRVSKAKSIVVTDYRGLTVLDMTILRAKLRAEGVEYKVVKNRLAKIALKDAGLPPMDELLKGTKAIALGMKDPVSPAKVLTAFAKDNDKLKIVGGQMDNRVLDANAILELSKLPSREVLLSRMLGSLTSPVQKLAFGLHQTVAKVVYALDAVARQKGGTAA
ncbi:MAG: 50S ribosomal protein L10 [Candidatus Sumerlaeaceae bacterium]|nr:50S ribosomal protein L10 [Candidatus Sumerlaeaceae bacterium]